MQICRYANMPSHHQRWSRKAGHPMDENILTQRVIPL